MNGRIERDFSDSIHLADIRRIQRKPFINWWALLGMGLVLLSATIMIYGIAKGLDKL